MCPVSNPNAVEPGTCAIWSSGGCTIRSVQFGRWIVWCLNGIICVLDVVAVDSTRYFVLRLDDGKGHHAFVGLGFQNRYCIGNSTDLAGRLDPMCMLIVRLG